ncbi:MAG: right-handed parallel beta-helix repeat-containing protein [Candidatus Bathyarchaeota archaeon]|nr:right-handed parallel beta-helix repeat-containing protein [Candidatus Bathyarchaeota archaeon]
MFLLISVQFTSLVNAQTQDSYEPDDSFTQYSTLTPSTLIQEQIRSIMPAGDNDYIRFYATPGNYTFYTSGSTDTYGYLYDQNQTQLISDDDSGDGVQFKFTYNITLSGNYYLRVRGYSNETIGDYALNYYYELGSLRITPNSGAGGVSVAFTGEGFPASSSVTIQYYDSFTASWMAFQTVTANGSGSIVFNTQMPDLRHAMPSGDNYENSEIIQFRAVVSSTPYCYAEYTQYLRGIKSVGDQAASGLYGNGTDLSQSVTVKAGEIITIAGNWFHANSPIYIRWDNTSVVGTVTSDQWSSATVIGNSIASASGSFEVNVTIPSAEVGNHYIAIEDSQGRVIITVLYALGSLKLSSTSGPGGAMVQFTGQGFTPSTPVAISYYDPTLGYWNFFQYVTADSNGKVAFSTEMPDLRRSLTTGDNYDSYDALSFRAQVNSVTYCYAEYDEYMRGIKVVDSQTASGLFGNGTNLAEVVSVLPGDSVPIIGKWFHAGSPIYIRWDGASVVGTVTGAEWNTATIVGNTIASPEGSFETTITIPSAEPGEHYVAIEDSQTRVIIKVLLNSPVDWSYTYGTTGSDVFMSGIKTSDGGYAFVGSTVVSSSSDVWLVKTDLSGKVQWNKTYGGSGSECGNSIIQLPDGSFVIAGYTSSYSGTNDMYLLRTNSTGHLQNFNVFGGNGTDTANSVIVDYDGNFLLAGSTTSYGGGTKAFLVKTNYTCSPIWTKTYGFSSADIANCVIQSNNGYYVLAGQTNNGTSNDFSLILIDYNGNMVYFRSYGSQNTPETAYNLIQTSDGGYLLSGTRGVLFNSSVAYIVRLNSNFDTTWETTYGTPYYGIGFSARETSSNEFVVGGGIAALGQNASDVLLLKLNSNGAVIASQSYGSSGLDLCRAVIKNADESFVLVGATNSYGAGGLDGLAFKVSALSVPRVHNLNSGISYNSIQKAIDSSSTHSGDTILVDSGYFRENVIIHKPVHLQSNNGSAIIDNGGIGSGVYVMADNVEVSGFTIQGTGWYSGVCGITIGAVSGANINSNYLQLNDYGIKVMHARNCQITSNHIQGCTAYGIHLDGSSQIACANNYLSSNLNGGADMGVYDSAGVTITNHAAKDSSLYVNGNSTVPLSNSAFNYLSSAGSAVVTMQNSILTNILTAGNSVLTVQNSRANWVSCYDAAAVNLVASNVSSIQVDGTVNLHVQDPTAVISQLYANGNSTVNVNKGTLYDLIAYCDTKLSISDASVNWLEAYNLSKTISMSNVTIGTFYLVNSNTYLLGNFTVLSQLYLEKSTVVRPYIVTVKDQSGSPVAGIALTLNRQGSTFWSGTTNATGSLAFNITYTEANYNLPTTLKAGGGDTFALQQFSLVTNSPILLTLQQHTAQVHNLNTGLNYYTIQDALDATQTLNGHVIKADSGVYSECPIINKSVKLRGAGNASTIIAAGNSVNVTSIRADNVEVSGFTIQGIVDPYVGSYGGAYGIVADRYSGANISYNVLVNLQYGVAVINATSVNISHNTFKNNQLGTVLYYTNNSQFTQNELTNNTLGFGSIYGVSNTIAGNNIQGNSTFSAEGLVVYLSTNNLITANTVTGNQIGIYMLSNQNSQLTYNRVGNNTIGLGILSASTDIVHHNFFLNNELQAITQSGAPAAVWDNGYPSGGNYWSDYNGTDSNHDGIGDTAYTIDSNNTDRYPIVYSTATFDAGTVNGTQCSVETLSNSTVANLNIQTQNKILSLEVSGTSGTAGFTLITLPNNLMQSVYRGIFTVYLDGVVCDYTSWSDANYTYIYLNYTHSQHTIQIQGDTTPPSTVTDYDNLWHSTSLAITLTATDAVGIDQTYYRINGGATKNVGVDGQPIITTEGATNTLEYWSTDLAGNTESHHTLSNIKLDKTAPTGSIQINSGAATTTSTSVNLAVTAQDLLSGVDKVRFRTMAFGILRHGKPSRQPAHGL